MDTHLIWSNDCTCQFKNAWMFYWLYILYVERGVPQILSFFKKILGMGKGNVGKCEVSLVKEKIKISATDLLDARSIVDWCSLTLSQGGTLDLVVHRFFWLVEEGSIGDRLDCSIVRDS